MTVQELLARFPEIPGNLSDEPVLARLAESCGPLLEVAHKPTNCTVEYDAGNHFYMALVSPIGIYGYGLMKREVLVAELQDLVDRYDADPPGFVAKLLPADVVPVAVRAAWCK